MRDMVMQMTGSNGLLSVPDEHLPGLVVLVLIGPVVWLALSGLRTVTARQVPWARRAQSRLDAIGFAGRFALFGCLVGALVHAVIVPTHWGDERVTAILFIADTAGFALAFWWTYTARTAWLLVAAAMLGGTACVYALYILKGWETMDPVGLLTTTIEAAAALVALSPALSSVRAYGVALAAAAVAMFSLIGTNVLADASATPTTMVNASAAGSPAGTAGSSSSGTAGMSMPAGSAPAKPLSLTTTSPAGNIEWPDDMATTMPGMKMAEPGCNAEPTVAQQQAAVHLVDQTVAAAQKYTSLATAKAAGYVPVTPTGKRVVHYINPSIYRSGDALDPGAIPSLVYVNTVHGAVLSAAMYLVPKGSTPPQPGGCLTQWHIHTDLCFSAGHVVGTDSNGSCSGGSMNRVTPPMMHVWMTPVDGGPLAPDPSALSEVQGALKMPVLSTLNATA
jgi:hypothetical protein